MDRINALGFIEVYGLVSGIEAADAMLKSAQVRLLRQYEVHPGLITVVVEGDLAACQAAVNAGVAAASRIGKVISSLLIPRPDGDTETMILQLITGSGRGGRVKEAKTAESEEKSTPAVKPKKAAPATKPAATKATGQTAKSTESSGDLDEALEFIFKAPKGRSWTDIAKRFSKQPQRLRKELDACVKSGTLDKVGARYRKTAAKE